MNSSTTHTESLTSIACLPTREKYYSEDANAPLERIGEWYLYTTDNGIPYYFNARTKKVVWDRPYRDIIPSPEPSDHEQDEDIEDTARQNRIESIPFGDTPFPHTKHHNASSTDNDHDDDDNDEDTVTNTIDIDDYFKTDKDKEDEELQYLATYNANIPPAQLSYPANELELLLQSKMDEFEPKLASKNIGSCTFKISADLPEGVDFDTNNGTISGFPMQCANKTLYTITASNKHGQTLVHIEIEVKRSENFYDDYQQSADNQKTVTFGFSGKKAVVGKETKELQFETQEQALAAFYELLANKGIRPQSTWSSIQSKLRRDPRYCALETEQKRKCAFAKYKMDLILASGDNALIRDEKDRVKRILSRFKDYLREMLNLERLEFIRNTYGKDKTKQKQIETKEDIETDVDQRIDIDGLCKEVLCGDERYHDLDDIMEERRCMIVDHIQVLEYQKMLEIEDEKKRKELEKKQDFMMLLHELSFGKSDPLFHTKTPFKTMCHDEVFVADERFAVFVKEEELTKATQYFEEFCIAMEHMLEADKQILKSFLRQHRQPVKHNDRVSQLVKYFGKSSRLSLIERPHLRLLFKEMIGKQQHLVKSGVIPSSTNDKYSHRRRSNGSTHGAYSGNRYDRYDRNGTYSRDKERDRRRAQVPDWDREKDKTRYRSRDRDRDRDRDIDQGTDKDRNRGRDRRRDRDMDRDSNRRKDPIRNRSYSKDRDRSRKYPSKERNQASCSTKRYASSKRKSASPSTKSTTKTKQKPSKTNSNKTMDNEKTPKNKSKECIQKSKVISSPSESGSTPNVISKPEAKSERNEGASTPNVIKKPKPKPKPKAKPKEDGEIEDEAKHKKSSKKDKKGKKVKKAKKKDKEIKEMKHKTKQNSRHKTKEKANAPLKKQKKEKDSKASCSSQSIHRKSSENRSKNHKNRKDERNGNKYKKNGDKRATERNKSSKNTKVSKERHSVHKSSKSSVKNHGENKYETSKDKSKSSVYSRWRGGEKGEVNHGRWQSSSNHEMDNKRERDKKRTYDVLREPPIKKRRINEERKYKSKSRDKGIDDRDRWQPERSESYKKKYKNRKSIMVDVEQEKERDKYRSYRERILRQKLLADVNT